MQIVLLAMYIHGTHERSTHVKNELLIHIDGKTLQPPKNILTKDELLELADLDLKRNRIVLITKQGEAHPIDSAEGLELQDGMEFRVRQDGS